MSEVDGSSRKTITRLIGDVYRFPNMLVENKIPLAYGTDGEYRTQEPVLSLPKGLSCPRPPNSYNLIL